MTSELSARVAALEAKVAALEAAAAITAMDRAVGAAGGATADDGAATVGRGALDLAWPSTRITADLGSSDLDTADLDGPGRPGGGEDLDGLRGSDRGMSAPPLVDGGEIGYQGSVRLHGRVEWGVRYAAVSSTELPAQPASGVLAALGHPIRVALAQRLLRGPATAAELQEVVGLSSTGQLYHHMRSLTSAGIAEQDGRGAYRVPARAVVPALVLLVAASDLARTIVTTSTS